MSKKTLLEWAEYVSLGFSCAGLIAATVSQQVAYAAIPLMINLPIGLTTRQRLDRRISVVSTQSIPAAQADLTKKIAQIESQFDRLEDRVITFDRDSRFKLKSIESTIETERAEFVKINDRITSATQLVTSYQQLSIITSEQATTIIQDLNDRLALLDASHQSLHDRTHNLGNLEQQLSTLQHQISLLEQNPLDVEVNINRLLDRSIGKQIDEVNKIIKETRKSFGYELVFDRSGSHQVLIDSFQQAKEQIVIICPWVSGHVIKDIYPHIEAALKRKVQISIGWGHLNDTRIYGKKSNDLYNNLNRNDLLRLNPQDWKYGGISILEKIQKKYPGQLKLKVIGTHEKFLVCDRQIAMVGSHNFLTSGESSPEREIGLKTNDPYIIDKLITRFNQPNILENSNSFNLN